jgi:hypothetical protein
MAHYQLYFFDAIKRTVEVTELDSFDDTTARSTLFSFKRGQPLELWSGHRLVSRVSGRSVMQQTVV